MRNYAYLFLFSFVLMFLNSCEVAVKKVELNAHNIVLALDSTEMLSAKITPEEIPDSILYLQSSDTSIITVDNGLVKAKKIGSAAVIVWADDMSDTCFFDVKIRVESINLNVSSVRIKNMSTDTKVVKMGKAGINML